MSADSSGGGGGAVAPRTPHSRLARGDRVLARIVRGWALFGGVLVAIIVLMTAAGAILNLAFRKPIPGDYELTKHFIAIAVFSFLPYCQLTGANVTVDIFTEGMSQRAKSAMAVLSSLLAALFSLLLLRQMSYGFHDYIRYPETTATLGVPLWTAFPPMLVSLVLLLLASLATGWDGIRGMRGDFVPPAPAPVSE